MGFDALLGTADVAVVGRLGRPVTYAPVVGAPVVVNGIFDTPYLAAESGVPGISTRAPAVFLKLSTLPSDPELDDPVITVGAETFKVKEVQKDGLGGVLLLLTKVS